MTEKVNLQEGTNEFAVAVSVLHSICKETRLQNVLLWLSGDPTVVGNTLGQTHWHSVFNTKKECH